MALNRKTSWQQQFTAIAAIAAGVLIQAQDGRAGVESGLRALASGDRVNLDMEGRFEFPKSTGVVFLKGGKAYWDRTNGVVTFKKVVGGFFLGCFAADAASADTTAWVDINVLPYYRIESNAEQIFATALVGSATATRDPVGSRTVFSVISTSEAEKSDALSNEAVAVADGPIFEARFTTVANGSTNAVDINIGLANGTHASDADSITNAVFFHIDGASQVINTQSTDGTTTRAAATTGVSITDGTYVEFWLDARDPTNVKAYIDGVAVTNSNGALTLTAATGPMKALVHLEKSSSAATGSVAIEFMRVRSTDLS